MQLAAVVLVALPLAYQIIFDLKAYIVLVGIILAIFAGFFAVLVLDHATRLTPFIPEKIKQEAAKLGEPVRMLFLTRRYAISTLGLAMLIHFLTALMVLVLALALNISAPLSSFFMLVPPVILISVVPVSLAGWGMREATMVVAFGFVAVAPQEALILSIYFGLVTLVSSLPGLIFFFKRQKSTDIPAASKE